MNFSDYLLDEATRHPSIQIQDIVKLCYQAAFGGEHLLQDMGSAEAYFRSEFASVPVSGAPLFEPISPDVCRVNIAAWKQRGLPPEWLFKLFFISAPHAPGKPENFLRNLEEAEKLIAAGALPVPLSAWRDYRVRYEQGAIRPVHHSGEYRESEKPSYRIVCNRFLRLFPLLEKMAPLHSMPGARVVAIDGRAASGKTTMAAQLEGLLQAGVVHMDDFFLPPGMRTKGRLSQPGGNVHHERFIEEALPHLKRAEPFSYRKFDCGKNAYAGERRVRESKWRIVEGAYSCHPAFGAYSDIRVFSDVPKDEQLQRIKRRDGGEAAQIFASKWIPLEEAYFAAYQIRETADTILL